ncbi:hypothetical protein HEL22_015865 [Escherichia sp. 14.0993]|uniref:hypothetical protein n=1 Tax=Escherichia sp. 14.0993 TaxID=2723302 RepID=UPI001602F261|nr:hypothetical protein [Escherichia sp. 14.0993]MBB2402238.1 hypothetical protein [Escherichia sp. 14.0993]
MSSRDRKFAAQPILPSFWIYWSLVAGRWSLVAGRWSLVWQHRIILFRKSMLFFGKCLKIIVLAESITSKGY